MLRYDRQFRNNDLSCNEANHIHVTYYEVLKLSKSHVVQQVIIYRISQPIRRNFFPEKCDLNSTCVLCAEGKYYFQTYK